MRLMGRPTDKREFWRDRLNRAHAEGRPARYAVWDADDDAWARMQARTRPVLLDHLKPGDSVLDAGCGIGSVYELLPPDLRERYHGVDVSPDFVAIARFRFPEGDFTVRDLRDLGCYRDGWFDWAVCRSVEGVVKTDFGRLGWNTMSRELRRVAKRVLLMDYDDPMTWEVLTP